MALVGVSKQNCNIGLGRKIFVRPLLVRAGPLGCRHDFEFDRSGKSRSVAVQVHSRAWCAQDDFWDLIHIGPRPWQFPRNVMLLSSPDAYCMCFYIWSSLFRWCSRRMESVFLSVGLYSVASPFLG